MSSKKLGIFNYLSKPFVKLVEKYYPDAFIFVIVLSLLTFLLAINLTNASPVQTLEAWGNGLPKLFTFTAQITIIMVTAHALAHTQPIERVLSKVGTLPNSSIQAYALVTFISGIASLFAWSFGLIVGGIVSKFVAIGCSKKNKHTLSSSSSLCLFRLCYLAYGLFIISCIICFFRGTLWRKKLVFFQLQKQSLLLLIFY